ncbi:alanine/glycine:cation symporter family protein [Pandoraea pulmonicola]|uniref:Na+/alanine symporter n=1 Tax=Pandoraea pulmonicola TaxID=93221 RepID=A0AAJ4ZDA4_PANPU|nr:alanine/glycine:cation symporter family protein [Pandoraea pulmonicola]AJC20377.1 sodium:alanine symporter [Pandoraea pulmonicola]SUA91242.1 Na+/alanine symporter [Pandoraea pulmonicola]
MEGWLKPIVDTVGGVLSGYPLIVVLLGAGLYFTLRFGGIQVRALWHSVCLLRISGGTSGISPFQAFATGLASRVGTGNIAGVAVALTIGGPGAIFWMWMTALLGMASAFVESTLAQIFKISWHDNTFRGGPAYYIQLGLGSRKFGIVFALALLFTFGFALNSVQSHSIAEALEASFGWERTWIGIALVLMTAPIIYGGVRRVARFAQWIVPVLAIAYLGLAVYICIVNIDQIPGMISMILRHAFGLEPAVGGIAGYAVSQAVLMGVKRGLFSNEAGMGSAPNAAAVATTRHPVQQGLMQMLGVFFDTIVVCSATAFMILLSGEFIPGAAPEGAVLTQRSLAAHVGNWAVVFTGITVFFLAYSSVLGNYAYAEVNMDYLTQRPWLLNIFRALVLLAVMLGSVASLPLVWSFADVGTALMAFINLFAIGMLMKYVLIAWRDYQAQRKAGIVEPVFTRDVLPPEMRERLSKDVWCAERGDGR